jgi:hypothetical protein
MRRCIQDKVQNNNKKILDASIEKNKLNKNITHHK